MPDITADMQFEPKQLGSYLKFLTIEQAMEDVAVFARDFSFPGLPGEDLTPGVTPWVFIGKRSCIVHLALGANLIFKAVRILALEPRGCVFGIQISSMPVFHHLA